MTEAAKPSAINQLLAILDLEQLEQNLFRGHSSQMGWQRVFGGQVIAQALVAACRTVEGRQPHSLHAYFLLPGDPKVPIIYEVDRIRDGRSFTTRRVVAIQHGAAIFTLSASFHADEPGFSHQMPMPDVPMPEDLPDLRQNAQAQVPEAVRGYFIRERPIELRPVEIERYASKQPREPKFHIWFRAAQALSAGQDTSAGQNLPDDPALHQCILAYASDMTLLDSSLIAHGRTVFDPTIQAASLDHALWFHRPFRVDEWLLYAQDSPSSSGALGFSRGLIFNRQGELVASVAQEGLVRQRTQISP
jgi:acyl-CoA thioesterase II